MRANDYHFITHWRVEGTREAVCAILQDANDLPRWWPSVYLDVQERIPGDAEGRGKIAELYTKGWLPYTLRWTMTVTESNAPHGFALDASGDLTGRGVWTLEQQAGQVTITYDWRVSADKLLLRLLSPLFKPVFAANHRWAMARGEKSLRLELARRAAPDKIENIPAPPGPTFPHWIKPSPLS